MTTMIKNGVRKDIEPRLIEEYLAKGWTYAVKDGKNVRKSRLPKS